VYTAFYDSGVKRLTEYMAISPDEALALLAEYDRPAIFLGDGSIAYPDKLNNIAPAHLSLQRASAVAALGMERAGDAIAYDKFELFYLRRPQAEREYQERWSQ
jgi:tRNA threonylcarbamoyladenosine biosynthesis protein TsaB